MLVGSGIIFILTLISATNIVKGDDINPGVYSTDSAPYGTPYQQWAASWWQWNVNVPTAQHPRENYTPEKCASEQQGPVWFLADSLSGTEERTCAIPAGKSVLVGVLTGACWTGPTLQSDQDVRQCGTEGNDYGVIGATLDGVRIQNLDQYRIDSGFFNITVPEDNIFDDAPGTFRAFTNGFFVFLEPLQPGTHDLRLTVSVTNPIKPEYNYAADWTYHLIVEGGQLIPLQGTSSTRDFRVEINWTSADIGSENTFSLKLMDANGQELRDATYDVMLFKGEMHLDETHRSDQTAREQKYIFDEQGSYTLRIENISDSGANNYISIPIQVTPEFPLGVFALTAATFAAIVGATRSKKLLSRS